MAIFSVFRSKGLLRVLGTLALTLVLTAGYYKALLQILSRPPPRAVPAVVRPVPAKPVPLARAPAPHSTVLITVSASVTADGVQVSLVPTAQDCSPDTARGPLRVIRTAGPLPELDLGLSESLCVAVGTAEAMTAAVSLGGAWRSASADELPDFDSAVMQWRYLTPTGQPAYVTLAAAGYCETDEGDCSAAIALSGTHDQSLFVLLLNLPEVGLAPLAWSAI